MSQTDNPTQLRDTSRFYSEVEAAVETIEEKYTSILSRGVQQLLKSQGMVIRIIPAKSSETIALAINSRKRLPSSMLQSQI